LKIYKRAYVKFKRVSKISVKAWMISVNVAFVKG